MKGRRRPHVSDGKRDGMNEDALAAVVAAAELLIARSRAHYSYLGAADDAAVRVAPSWTVAGRMRTADPKRARLVARARSRWSMSGRLRD
jgi:hypothetical protein